MEGSIPKTLTVSLVFNLLLGLTFGGLYVFLYPGMLNKRDKLPRVNSLSTTDFKANSFCMSCDDLGRWVTVNETLYSDIVTTDCGHRLCCVKDDVLRDFLTQASAGAKERNEMSENKTSTVKKYFEFWRRRQNAAHLYIDDSNPVSKGGVIQWRDTDSFGTAFVSNVILEDKKQLLIMENGTYYVYLALNVPQDHRRESRNFHVYLRVHISTRKLGPKILLSKKFKNDKNRKSTLVSLHGVFKFKKHHKVEVSIQKNVRTLIDKTSMSNYFGIYKLN